MLRRPAPLTRAIARTALLTTLSIVPLSACEERSRREEIGSKNVTQHTHAALRRERWRARA